MRVRAAAGYCPVPLLCLAIVHMRFVHAACLRLQGYYCDNMVPVASSFTCKPKAPVGTVCLYDRVCGSGHCVAGFCRACGEDKHCAAGEFCELSVLQPTSLWTCK